jgi:D-glycero-alpha-D-manno-heptose 1-phosphate guanylyltransferase
MSAMMDAVILAGGLGTRLQGKIPELPKCMAPVAGKPFIDHVIHFLLGQGVRKVIFSLGYKHEVVLNHLKQAHSSLDYTISIEQQPLGTGGGTLLAAQQTQGKEFLLLNGDTLFLTNIAELRQRHEETQAVLTMALKPMVHFNRYGSVIIRPTNQVIGFEEKKQVTQGLINGGLYLVNRDWLYSLGLPPVCSFEKDVLESHVNKGRFYSYVSDGYFIDIGIPEDYDRANRELVDI